ncbi:MAG: helix-turn-helix transcriptional regulator [Desulfobacterales bacterium]|nr:helix-turn-helix transcriptional regulator [Desulfobacterales bacterium]
MASGMVAILDLYDILPALAILTGPIVLAYSPLFYLYIRALTAVDHRRQPGHAPSRHPLCPGNACLRTLFESVRPGPRALQRQRLHCPLPLARGLDPVGPADDRLRRFRRPSPASAFRQGQGGLFNDRPRQPRLAAAAPGRLRRHLGRRPGAVRRGPVGSPGGQPGRPVRFLSRRPEYVRDRLPGHAPARGHLRPLLESEPGRRYERSSLTPENAALYETRLRETMEREKLFLDPELTLPKLARALDLPASHLSQVINERLGRNFFEFINGYRVDAARQRLANPAPGQQKLVAIAFDCGFNSLATFNRVFKELAGRPPSDFRKHPDLP